MQTRASLIYTLFCFFQCSNFLPDRRYINFEKKCSCFLLPSGYCKNLPMRREKNKTNKKKNSNKKKKKKNLEALTLFKKHTNNNNCGDTKEAQVQRLLESKSRRLAHDRP